MKMTPHAERMRARRIALLLDEPFFGQLLMNLKTVETRNVKTFSTDATHLFYNPDFMDTLTDAEIGTVLAHEVLHCGLHHPFRRGSRDLKKFNIAADYAVNNFLDQYNQQAHAAGRTLPFPIPKGGLLDHQYDDLSAEEIYGRMIDPPPSGGGGQGQPQQGAGKQQQGQQPGKGQGQQPGQGGGGQDDEPSSPGEFTDGAADQADAEEQEAQWTVAMKQAALVAKGQGKLPAALERLINELLAPKVPWTEILRTFITSTARDDYSWARPNRRYSGSSVILPGLHSPRLGPVIVAVDTSGSIGQKEFDEFMAEARSVLFDCRPEKFILCQCDAAVHDWRELDPNDDMRVDSKGGGGTDFRPVFERALDEMQCGDAPACLIYLTDMMGDFPENEPPFPVLWAATTDIQAPFGTTLKIS